MGGGRVKITPSQWYNVVANSLNCSFLCSFYMKQPFLSFAKGPGFSPLRNGHCVVRLLAGTVTRSCLSSMCRIFQNVDLVVPSGSSNGGNEWGHQGAILALLNKFVFRERSFMRCGKLRYPPVHLHEPATQGNTQGGIGSPLKSERLGGGRV